MKIFEFRTLKIHKSSSVVKFVFHNLNLRFLRADSESAAWLDIHRLIDEIDS